MLQNVWFGALAFLEGFSSALLPFLPILLVAHTLIFGVFIVVQALKKRIERRKHAMEKREREKVFTLPDRENSFIRERLNGALKVGVENAEKRLVCDEKLRIEYARKLLAKLKSSSLTPADRLEANRLSRQITEKASKEEMTVAESNALVENFLGVLKLSSKYFP